jgi:hypothetical protein
LEIEAGVIVEIRRTKCNCVDSEGDYTLGKISSQAKQDGKRADLGNAWKKNGQARQAQRMMKHDSGIIPLFE